MPPVSSLSWAENEVQFPVRFAKNRTSSVVYGQFNVFHLFVAARFLLVCPATANKESADPQAVSPIEHTSSEPSTVPQLMELVDGSRQTNFSL